MVENLEVIKNTFLEYWGSGLYIFIYIFSIIYIVIKEKENEKKCMFVIFPLLLSVIIINPFFFNLVKKFITAGVYSRMYWAFPLGVTIAYAFVNIIEYIKLKRNKVFCCIIMVILIIFSGKLIYTSNNYIKVDNLYKLPDEHIEIIKVISNDKLNKKKAFVSEDIVAHIRQIDSNIELAYRRNPSGYQGNIFVETMHTGDAEKISKLAIENNCNYIIMNKNIIMNSSIIEYGFEILYETTNYIIYKKK